MRKTTLIKCVGFLALAILLLGAKCPGIPKTHEIDITLVTDEFIELTFLARGSLNVNSDIELIDVDELRQDLEDAGVEIDLIDTIRVSAVEYGVVAYNEAVNDRQIADGTVSLKRLDEQTTHTLISGVNVMVYPLLGKLVPAPIEPGGIDFINEILADALAILRSGGSTTFQVMGMSSGVSNPQSRTTNFDWRVRIHYQLAGGYPVDVPDF